MLGAAPPSSLVGSSSRRKAALSLQYNTGTVTHPCHTLWHTQPYGTPIPVGPVPMATQARTHPPYRARRSRRRRRSQLAAAARLTRDQVVAPAAARDPAQAHWARAHKQWALCPGTGVVACSRPGGREPGPRRVGLGGGKARSGAAKAAARPASRIRCSSVSPRAGVARRAGATRGRHWAGREPPPARGGAGFALNAGGGGGR